MVVVFSPDSSLVASDGTGFVCVVTGTPTAVLVDPRSGAETLWLLHPTPVRHAASSADGALVATVGDDRVAPVPSLVDSQLDRRDPP